MSKDHDNWTLHGPHGAVVEYGGFSSPLMTVGLPVSPVHWHVSIEKEGDTVVETITRTLKIGKHIDEYGKRIGEGWGESLSVRWR